MMWFHIININLQTHYEIANTIMSKHAQPKCSKHTNMWKIENNPKLILPKSFFGPREPKFALKNLNEICTTQITFRTTHKTQKPPTRPFCAKRKHNKRLLAKIYYSPQSKVGWRLVQNACRNWAIAPGVTQRGPKYAKEP